jgi:hypothetical protein
MTATFPHLCPRGYTDLRGDDLVKAERTMEAMTAAELKHANILVVDTAHGYNWNVGVLQFSSGQIALFKRELDFWMLRLSDEPSAKDFDQLSKGRDVVPPGFGRHSLAIATPAGLSATAQILAKLFGAPLATLDRNGKLEKIMLQYGIHRFRDDVDGIIGDIIAKNPGKAFAAKTNPDEFSWFVGQTLRATFGSIDLFAAKRLCRTKLGVTS